jgi:ABC-type molybdate transport system substrate-binding protein
MDMMRRLLVASLLVLCALAGPAAADTLRVAGAGSLSDALPDLLRRFPAGVDSVAPAEFGPSGLLRQKIEAGAVVDLFASADMAHPRALAAGHPERFVINLTGNRLCALARPAIGLTADNMLDRLLDPAVRLATSTPGADPGGDYAWAMFARAEVLRPGARAALESKALPLVGGGDKTPLLVPGKGAVEGVFIADRADVMLGYCSGAAAVQHEVAGLVSVPLPPGLAVGADYGLVILDPRPVVLRFVAFVLSESGQAVLRAHGFTPVALPAAAPPPDGLLVQRRGQPARLLTPAALAALKPLVQHVVLAPEHGNQPADWSGPLLWDVLLAAGAVDAGKPGDQVRLTVRVTGADGYVAILALGELSPEFGGRSVQLADHLNGVPLPGGSLRLVVPGEKRGGRSVRDVIRIDID